MKLLHLFLLTLFVSFPAMAEVVTEKVTITSENPDQLEGAGEFVHDRDKKTIKVTGDLLEKSSGRKLKLVAYFSYVFPDGLGEQFLGNYHGGGIGSKVEIVEAETNKSLGLLSKPSIYCDNGDHKVEIGTSEGSLFLEFKGR